VCLSGVIYAFLSYSDRSGKEVVLPPSPPRETARARFHACNLSLANALCRTRCLSLTLRHLHDTRPKLLPVTRGNHTSMLFSCRHLHCLILRYFVRSGGVCVPLLRLYSGEENRVMPPDHAQLYSQEMPKMLEQTVFTRRYIA
jgi:hypothetical protein